jgi:rRNA maturation RNase YbeY
LIFFQVHGVPDAFRGRHALCDWLAGVARAEGRTVGDITFVLMSDRALLDYNRKYLGHDLFTDVITFPDGAGSELAGDILISYDRIKANAKLYGVGAQQELHRVMVHGLLHLCGHKDKTLTQRTSMSRLEDHYLGWRRRSGMRVK